MSDQINIVRYNDIAGDLRNSVAAEMDVIFFDASTTKVFATREARMDFRQRWLGRYLGNDPHHAYLAIDSGGRVAGYLVGTVADSGEIAADYPFAAHVANFPAHFHINVGAEHRGRGIGARLIEIFADSLVRVGVSGVHVITTTASDNVRFYRRCGFVEAGRGGAGNGLMFLGRKLS